MSSSDKKQSSLRGILTQLIICVISLAICIPIPYYSISRELQRMEAETHKAIEEVRRQVQDLKWAEEHAKRETQQSAVEKRNAGEAIADRKESARAADAFEERIKNRTGAVDIDDGLMGNLINAITSTEVRAKADARRPLKDTFDPQTKSADDIDFVTHDRFRDTDPRVGVDPEDHYVYNSAGEAMTLDEIIDQQKRTGRTFLSDAEMNRFRSDVFGPAHNEANDALLAATRGFGREKLRPADEKKVHEAIDAFSDSVSGDIAKKYGLSPELQEALNRKISNQLKQIAFDDKGNYRGNVAGQARELIDNQALMEYLGTDVAQSSGNKAAANRAFIDELDAVARKVYGLEDKEGSEFGTLSEEQQKLILAAIAEGGVGEGQAELESASKM